MAPCRRYTSESTRGRKQKHKKVISKQKPKKVSRKNNTRKNIIKKQQCTKPTIKKNRITHIAKYRSERSEEKKRRKTKSVSDWVTELVYRYIGRVGTLYHKCSSGLSQKISEIFLPSNCSSSSLTMKRSNSNLNENDSPQTTRISRPRSNACIPSTSRNSRQQLPHSNFLENVRSYLSLGFEEGLRRATDIVQTVLDYGIRSGVVEAADNRGGLYRVLQPSFSESNLTKRRVRFQMPGDPPPPETWQDRLRQRRQTAPEDLGLDDSYDRPRSTTPEDVRRERMKRTAVRHSSSLYPCRSRMSWARRKLRSALKKPSTLNQASRADVASRKKSVTTNNKTKRQRQGLGRSKTDRVERSRSTIRRNQSRTQRSSSSSSSSIGSSGCSSSTELRTDKKRRRSQMLRRPTKSGKFDNTSNGRSRSTIPKVSARRRKRSSSQLKSPDDEGQDKSWFSRSGTIKAVKKYAKHVPDSRGSSSASSDSSYSDSSRSPSPRNKRRRCKPSATTASKARFTTHKRRSRSKSKSRKN